MDYSNKEKIRQMNKEGKMYNSKIRETENEEGNKFPTYTNLGMTNQFQNELFKNKAAVSKKLYQLTPREFQKKAREFQKKGIKTKLLFNPKPNPLYILNPFNLTLLISMIYMIYWDNWGSPSWEKWSIYISSVIVFNLLLGLIYFFQTRTFQTRTKKDQIVNSGTRNSHYRQNTQNNDLWVQNNQNENTDRESFHKQL